MTSELYFELFFNKFCKQNETKGALIDTYLDAIFCVFWQYTKPRRGVKIIDLNQYIKIMGVHDHDLHSYFRLDVNSFCAICTIYLESNTAKSLHVQLMQPNNTVKAYEVLQSISRFKMNAKSPQLVCKMCLNNLKSVFKFQSMCYQSQVFFDSHRIYNKALLVHNKKMKKNKRDAEIVMQKNSVIELDNCSVLVEQISLSSSMSSAEKEKIDLKIIGSFDQYVGSDVDWVVIEDKLQSDVDVTGSNIPSKNPKNRKEVILKIVANKEDSVVIEGFPEFKKETEYKSEVEVVKIEDNYKDMKKEEKCEEILEPKWTSTVDSSIIKRDLKCMNAIAENENENKKIACFGETLADEADLIDEEEEEEEDDFDSEVADCLKEDIFSDNFTEALIPKYIYSDDDTVINEIDGQCEVANSEKTNLCSVVEAAEETKDANKIEEEDGKEEYDRQVAESLNKEDLVFENFTQIFDSQCAVSEVSDKTLYNESIIGTGQLKLTNVSDANKIKEKEEAEEDFDREVAERPKEDLFIENSLEALTPKYIYSDDTDNNGIDGQCKVAEVPDKGICNENIIATGELKLSNAKEEDYNGEVTESLKELIVSESVAEALTPKYIYSDDTAVNGLDSQCEVANSKNADIYSVAEVMDKDIYNDIVIETGALKLTNANDTNMVDKEEKVSNHLQDESKVGVIEENDIYTNNLKETTTPEVTGEVNTDIVDLKLENNSEVDEGKKDFIYIDSFKETVRSKFGVRTKTKLIEKAKDFYSEFADSLKEDIFFENFPEFIYSDVININEIDFQYEIVGNADIYSLATVAESDMYNESIIETGEPKLINANDANWIEEKKMGYDCILAEIEKVDPYPTNFDTMTVKLTNDDDTDMVELKHNKDIDEDKKKNIYKENIKQIVACFEESLAELTNTDKVDNNRIEEKVNFDKQVDNNEKAVVDTETIQETMTPESTSEHDSLIQLLRDCEVSDSEDEEVNIKKIEEDDADMVELKRNCEVAENKEESISIGNYEEIMVPEITSEGDADMVELNRQSEVVEHEEENIGKFEEVMMPEFTGVTDVIEYKRNIEIEEGYIYTEKFEEIMLPGTTVDDDTDMVELKRAGKLSYEEISTPYLVDEINRYIEGIEGTQHYEETAKLPWTYEDDINMMECCSNLCEVSIVTEEDNKVTKDNTNILSYKESMYPNLARVEEVEEYSSNPASFQVISQSSNSYYPGFTINKDGWQKQTFTCGICSTIFENRSDLMRHARTHTPEEKMVSCSHCNAKFKKASALKIHERRHTGERPFHCSICPKAFASNGYLQQHIRSHNGFKPYACMYCKEKFKYKTTCRNHERTQACIIGRGNRPFDCTICDKCFKSRSILNGHLRCHATDADFPCKHCDATFTCQSHVNRHEQIHNKPLKYMCQNCDQGFYFKKDYIVHQRIHTKEMLKIQQNDTIIRFLDTAFKDFPNITREEEDIRKKQEI